MDAWVFSGYRNEDAPAEVVGVNGYALKLNNFAYTEESGFNTTTYNGALFFDGVDDWVAEKLSDLGITDEDAITVVGKYVPITTIFPYALTHYIRDMLGNGYVRTQLNFSSDVGQTQTIAYSYDFAKNTSSAIVGAISVDGGTIKVANATRFSLSGYYNNRSNSIGQNVSNAHYYTAIYKRAMTLDEVNAEIEKLEKMWNKKLK